MHIESKYMSECFFVFFYALTGVMRRSNEAVIIVHTHTHTRTTYMRITQRPSKQGRLGPLRGADSFLGK